MAYKERQEHQQSQILISFALKEIVFFPQTLLRYWHRLVCAVREAILDRCFAIVQELQCEAMLLN